MASKAHATLIIFLGVVLAAALTLFLSTSQRSLNENALLQQSKNYSEFFEQMRVFYLSELLGNIDNPAITISHDYRNLKNALPIPATFSLDFGEFLNERSSTVTVALVSDYPFPWRSGRDMTEFDTRALDALRGHKTKDIFEIITENGLPYAHYAAPVIMSQGCVDCHNSHPDSPKTDWKVGDVRGIQVVEVPVSNELSTLDFDIAAMTAAIIAIGFIAVIGLLILNHREGVARNSLVSQNRELALERSRADEASKAKSQFLANMSHEIRTPLNGIIGMLQLLNRNKLDEESRANIQVTEQSAAALLEIVNGILDISKIEARKLQRDNTRFSLRKLAADLEAQFKAVQKNGDVEFQLELDADLPSEVIGDLGKIRQIISNLLSNSIKFTHDGFVRLTIATEKSEESEDASLVHVRFTVVDSGIGISEENQTKLFEPFQQVDASMTRRYGGTGLGLSIVRELTAFLSGDLLLSSEPNCGTTISVTLPVKKAPAISQSDQSYQLGQQMGSSEAVAELPPQRTALRALIVDDNTINRKVLSHMLAKLDIEAKSAQSGAEAIKAVQSTHFDIVFMDLQMPEMDGFETTQYIRDCGFDTLPIVACTAHAFDSDKEKCLEFGMQGFISKPVKIEDLEQLILQVA